MPVYTTVTANGKTCGAAQHCAPALEQHRRRGRCGRRARSPQLRQKLPPGVKLEPFYDQSQLVRDSISSVRDAIFIGLILACIILFLFLRDWTSSLIAGLVIPVTVAVTILVLWAHRPELQPDDARRTRRRHRPRDRRRHRRGRKHRHASRQRRASRQRCAQGPQGNHRSADRLHHHAGRRVSAAYRRHRRHRQLLPRAGHHHDCVAADFAGAGAYLDARPEPRAAARPASRLGQATSTRPAAFSAAFSNSIAACSTGRWPSRCGSASPACCS